MLIALSGIDGAGKSTQLKLVKQYFEANGKAVVYLWARGGSTNGINLVKALSRRLAGKALPPPGRSVKRDELFAVGWIQRAWLVLAIIDLMRLYAVVVRWWIFNGKVVLCDRYVEDTLIDFKIMFPDVDVEFWLIWKILVKLAPLPDKSVLLTIPVSVSEHRCAQKHDPYPEGLIDRKRRNKLYKVAASKNIWTVLNADRDIDLVFNDIVSDDVV